MSTDHLPSAQERERLWMREQIGRIAEMSETITNLYQNIAVLARLAKVTPAKMVKTLREPATMAFLMNCMQEEQKLNEKLKSPSAETSAAIEQLTIKDNEEKSN